MNIKIVSLSINKSGNSLREINLLSIAYIFIISAFRFLLMKLIETSISNRKRKKVKKVKLIYYSRLLFVAARSK